MLYRGVFALGAALLALAGIGQRHALQAVESAVLEIDPGVQASVYWPDADRGDRPLPTVILAHGWGSHRSAVSALARQLASAGYAALTIELPGHGSSPRALPRGGPAAQVIADALDAAVSHARVQGRFDGQRLALLGHGLGADAALEYASRDPSLAAVIALSPQRRWTGSYSPPNALLIWAEDQSRRQVRASRELARQLAGLRQIRVGRSYGEFERGSAVRAVELEGGSYLSLLFSAETARESRAWLARAMGPGRADDDEAEVAVPPVESAPQTSPPPPGVLHWSLLGLLGAALLFAAIAHWVPAREPLPTEPLAVWSGLGRYVVALAVAVFLTGAGQGGDSSGAFAFFPFGGARSLLGVWVVLGAVLGCLAAARGQWRRPPLQPLGVACGLAVFLYCAGALWLRPAFDPWLGPARLAWALLAAALVLPSCVLSEQLLRGGGTGWIAPALAKGLLFGALIGASLLGWLPGEWLLLAPGLGLLLLALELAALRLHLSAPGPWLAGTLQALALGWFLAAGFPREL